MMALAAMTVGLMGTTRGSTTHLFMPIQNTSVDPRPHVQPHRGGITWDDQLNLSEPGGCVDTVIFGEATDANNGPPADSYDVAKPPAPIAPYIRAYTKDHLSVPYTSLWMDYRHYSALKKSWNLTVHWEPEDGESSTSITMSWSTNKLNASEYDKVVLLDNATGGVLVSNMFTTNHYTYTASFGNAQFRINCSVDTKKPQIINYSPATGGTGDSYTFNVDVFDDMTPSSSLIVKVNWVHGGLSGNDTMAYMGGNNFQKTITLDDHSVSPLTYHIYAKDTAKVPNANYTSALTATISDDDQPVIDTVTGDTSGTTGETTTISATFHDNIGVTVATLYYKSASAGSYSSMSILSGSAGILIPEYSVESWYYYVTVDDAAGTGPVGKPSTDGSTHFTITVSDNDPPQISAITATPAAQLTDNHVNITGTITDNININIVKVNISGPAGFTVLNATMFHKTGSNTYYYNQSYSIVGTYTYYLWARDTNNNGKQSSSYQFEIFGELQITTLRTSWNFVSLPFNLTTPKTNLFVVLSNSTRWTWGQAVFHHYVYDAIYNWTRKTQGYDTPTSLLPGEGYWVYSYNDNVQLWATNLTPIVTTPYITQLKSLWNVIGVPLGSSVSKDSLVVTYNGVDYSWADAVANGYVMKDIFGWTRTAPQSYFLASTLDPGYSYWLYAYTSCTLKRTA